MLFRRYIHFLNLVYCYSESCIQEIARCHGQDLIKSAMFPMKISLQYPIWPETKLKGSQQRFTLLDSNSFSKVQNLIEESLCCLMY